MKSVRRKTSQPKNSGLLWDSFISKEEPVYSSIIEYITGYSSNEINMLPGRAFSLLNEEDAERQKAFISDFIINAQKKELEIIYPINTKFGLRKWLKELVLTSRSRSGEITGFECSVAEFTSFLDERSVLQADLKNLHDLNKAKDQFISVLSHDLKSPYTSILGFSEILLNETRLTPEERSEYLQFINHSSQNQLKLIDKLLEWSRLVTGRKKLEKYKFNLNTLLNTVISNNTRDIHKKRLQVNVNSDDNIYVQADERLMDLLLNVFLSNAVKYSLPEKTIDIYINRFKDNLIEVVFKDEGIGMSEIVRDRLMKIDKVVSVPGTNGERGTGISLLLALEIIKNHDGDLWFYSDEGSGAEFHFTISAAGNSILLIDDNNSSMHRISRMLKTGFPQFNLRTESNFYSALDSMKTETPAVIIMKHKLTLMDGLEFTKALKSDQGSRSIPLIVYAEELNEDITEQYQLLGVKTILPEPVNLKDLRGLLEDNLK